MNKLMKLKEGEEESNEENFLWHNLNVLGEDLTTCWEQVKKYF